MGTGTSNRIPMGASSWECATTQYTKKKLNNNPGTLYRVPDSVLAMLMRRDVQDTASLLAPLKVEIVLQVPAVTSQGIDEGRATNVVIRG